MIDLTILFQPCANQFQMRLVSALGKLGVEKLWVDFLYASEALKVQGSEEFLEERINIDVPQFCVFVDFGLEFEDEIGEGFEGVRDATDFKAVLGVAEHHEQEIVCVVQGVKLLMFFILMNLARHTPQQLHLNLNILPPKTKPAIDNNFLLSVPTHVLELRSL